MVKVLDRKNKVMMVAKSVGVAMAGLQSGTYKKGSYLIVDEESGKVVKFDKYVCRRKSR